MRKRKQTNRVNNVRLCAIGAIRQYGVFSQQERWQNQLAESTLVFNMRLSWKGGCGLERMVELRV